MVRDRKPAGHTPAPAGASSGPGRNGNGVPGERTFGDRKPPLCEWHAGIVI
ncbi:hypothetical protein FRUB_10198 [Fimbriiglobus ruber]|uniref:Uncharacterized protein n=1 Tax=Fimbriiglobus ruber TaxID=1908690 RepID=A0A225DDN4_9BACT|nr:hypothetical protein FRUB_10198 [Fimbriiglobus ruber]